MEENKTELIPVGNGLRVLVFMGMGLLSVITGIVLTPSLDAIREGLVLQQTATGLLDMNSFLVVGEHIGVPYINAGLLLIFVMVSYLFTKTPVNGGAIAAAFMVYGFGFCGKTLWNVWPLFAGVLVLNTAVLHGWMNLYNNGFCLGLVVTFFVPAILNLLGRDKQKPA